MRPGQLPIIRQAAAPPFTSQRANYSPIPPHDKKDDDLGGPYGQESPNPEHRQKQNRYLSPTPALSLPPNLVERTSRTIADGSSHTQAGGSPSAQQQPSAWPSASSPSSPSSRRPGRSPSTRSRTTRSSARPRPTRARPSPTSSAATASRPPTSFTRSRQAQASWGPSESRGILRPLWL